MHKSQSISVVVVVENPSQPHFKVARKTPNEGKMVRLQLRVLSFENGYQSKPYLT